MPGSAALSPEQVAAAGYLLDPAAFAREMSGGHYQIPRWIDYVSRRVAKAMAKGGARILISVPPQHGKSLLFAGWLPVWAQENSPGRMIGVVSYSATLAARWVRFGRDMAVENASRLRIAMGKCSEDYWESVVPGKPPGYVRAMGITGSITGFGYDDLVMDDLYADTEQAWSPTHRAKVEDAYWAVLEGRLAERANVIGIMTRWHHDDIFGKLIRSGEYEEIRIPALAEENDPLGRAKGEALWEERHSRQKLERRKLFMPPRIWAAQYQGRPEVEEGAMIRREWWQDRIIDARPALVSGRNRYWDPAASRGQKASDPDYLVGTLMSRVRDHGPLSGSFCVEHISRTRGSALDAERVICSTAAIDGPGVPILIEQEPGSTGVSYVEHFKRLLPGYRVRGVPHGAGRDKASRVKPFAAQMEVGNVVWVRGPWLEQAIDEMCRFVGDGSEDHDDVPDSVTGAFEGLVGSIRWPWETAARDPRDDVRDRRGGQFGREAFDRGDFARALDRCAPAGAVRAAARGGVL